jgi:hypothetical protein
VQLQRFALLYDPDAQRTGYLLGGCVQAVVVDGDGYSHLIVVTDQYGSVRLVVGEHFLKVAVDGERQAGSLLAIVG